MRASLDERVDDPPEGEQTFVNQACFSSPLVLGAATLDVLAPCEIHQIQFSSTYEVFTVLGSSLDIYCDSKNCVASRTKVIALRRCNLPLVAASLQQLDTSIGVLYVRFLHTLNNRSAMALSLAILENLQFRVLVYSQEIAQLFVVQLDERAFNGALSLVSLKLSEQRMKDPWNDTSGVREQP